MTVSDPRTLQAINEVSRTADKLARRMGGHYVMKVEWRLALSKLQDQDVDIANPTEPAQQAVTA